MLCHPSTAALRYEAERRHSREPSLRAWSMQYKHNNTDLPQQGPKEPPPHMCCDTHTPLCTHTHTTHHHTYMTAHANKNRDCFTNDVVNMRPLSLRTFKYCNISLTKQNRVKTFLPFCAFFSSLSLWSFL